MGGLGSTKGQGSIRSTKCGMRRYFISYFLEILMVQRHCLIIIFIFPRKCHRAGLAQIAFILAPLGQLRHQLGKNQRAKIF